MTSSCKWSPGVVKVRWVRLLVSLVIMLISDSSPSHWFAKYLVLKIWHWFVESLRNRALKRERWRLVHRKRTPSKTSGHSLGTFRSDDATAAENVKKSNRFNKQNNNYYLFSNYVVLTFESAEKILGFYHLNETFSAILSHGTIYVLCSSNFWVCGWNPMVLPFTWNLFSSTFTWCYLLFSSLQDEIWNATWGVKGLCCVPDGYREWPRLDSLGCTITL